MIECYETILRFPNFPLYKKKIYIYEKFRGPSEHEAPLKSASAYMVELILCTLVGNLRMQKY